MSGSTTTRRLRRTAALTVMLALSLTSLVRALDDYVLGSPQNGYMPDFDQVRTAGPLVFDGMSFYPDPPGLPNSGVMYCVPTASIDVMAYLANHGYPSAIPGAPLSWQSQDQYDLVTAAIAQMGVFMETHPVDGTLGKGRSGTQEWIDTFIGPDTFVVDSTYAKNSYGPNLYEIAAAALSGQLVIMNVGWYDEVTTGHWVRTGGHQTVVTGTTQNDGYFVDGCQVRFRDPGSGGDAQTQSTFSNTTKTVDYISGQFSNSDDPIAYSNRTMARLLGYGSGAKKGFIQGYYKITPLFGIGGNGLQLDFVNPYPVGPEPLPFLASQPVQGGASLADFAIHPLKTCVFYTMRDASGAVLPEVRCLDRLSGESTIALVASAPSALAFGGSQRLYTVDGNCVNAYDLDPTSLVGSYCIGATIDAIAVDDVNDRVFAVSTELGVLIVLDENLETAVELPLPTVLPLGGSVSMATDPKSGDLWIKGSSSETVCCLRYVPGTVDPATGATTSPTVIVIECFSDPSLAGGTGIDCSGGEHIFWVKGGIVHEHARNAAGGWSEVSDSPFAGMAAQVKFVLARAAENRNEEERADAANTHLLPDAPEQAFRRGDCNGDLAFDIADAIRTLSFLFAGDVAPNCLDACDSNDDGAADIGDAIYALSTLFSGGLTPPAPYEECGNDPTSDSLNCASYPCE
ncbi:MAG: hypothetical protein KDC38_01065 [Planctomycetes bacterium]|nr:hypothetical protein [Planctomycetota bacterium]